MEEMTEKVFFKNVFFKENVIKVETASNALNPWRMIVNVTKHTKNKESSDLWFYGGKLLRDHILVTF